MKFLTTMLHSLRNTALVLAPSAALLTAAVVHADVLSTSTPDGTPLSGGCGIEGSVTWSDGSKSDKSTTVSTSWNSKKAYPSKGWYTLDLGSDACGQSMTVYLDGSQGTRVTLPSSGNARVDFVAK